MRDITAAIVLFALALGGLANAIYFTLLFYRVLPPDAARTPTFCRLDRRTCEAVVFTRYGRLLFVPNSLFGIFFYLLLLFVALSRLETGVFRYLEGALYAALLALLVSLYLLYALLVKLKAPCPL